MLRRIGIAIRWSLLVLGVAALVLLPVSFFVPFAISISVPNEALNIFVVDGTLEIKHDKAHNFIEYPSSWDVTVIDRSVWPIHFKYAFRPYWRADEYTVPGHKIQTTRILIVPLWMIAAASLAWPVLAWRAARRRRRRGFDVTLVDDAVEAEA